MLQSQQNRALHWSCWEIWCELSSRSIESQYYLMGGGNKDPGLFRGLSYVIVFKSVIMKTLDYFTCTIDGCYIFCEIGFMKCMYDLYHTFSCSPKNLPESIIMKFSFLMICSLFFIIELQKCRNKINQGVIEIESISTFVLHWLYMRIIVYKIHI